MTLSKSFAAALCAATFALGAPLCAQGIPPEPESAAADEVQRAENDDTIVVTGDNAPITIRQIQRQARDIAVRSGNIYRTPLARFEDRLCPGIIGLEPEFAGLMIDRIRDNARALDIRLLDDGCNANFVVAFVEDGGAMLSQMIDNNPEYFQYLHSGQRRAMLEPGPVHVWNNVEPRTLTGMPVAQVRNLASPPVLSANAAHSRIYTALRRDIASIMVIFDREPVRGMNLRQLADYATMRGLAETQSSGDLDVDTILTLFNGRPSDPTWAPPQELTEFDRAYLNALYDFIPNLPAASKLLRVGREMRELSNAGGDEGD